jgi:AAA+ superfamily predicted ATPase
MVSVCLCQKLKKSMKQKTIKTETLINNTLLQSITKLHNNHSNLYKEESTIEEYNNELKIVCDFFDVEPKTGVLLSVIICDQLIGEVRYIHKVFKNIGFSSLEIISLNNQIKDLVKRSWLKQSNKTFPYAKEIKSNQTEYIISQHILNAVLFFDKELIENERPLDFTDGLIKLRNYMKHLVDSNLYEDEMYDGVQQFLWDFKENTFLKEITESQELLVEEKLILFWLSSEYIFDREEFDLDAVCDFLGFENNFIYNFKQRIKNDKSTLFNTNYLSFVNPELADFSSITYGDKMLDLLTKTCVKVEQKKIKHKFCQLIQPDDIEFKNLYFNARQQQDITKIIDMLSPENYKKMCENFKSHKMKEALSLLFYGLSGTGKTELVRQIAKKHNRILLMVDIASIKSMWVGESEKNIRRVFREYAEALKICDLAPILFFNEADAILNKRRKIESSSDQMLNSMQNILLQYLEDFEGIFMATTNYINNLDDAFDRRIFYKKAFELPDENTRFQILQDLFPEWPGDWIKDIASDFELSGSQIQNIKRKLLVDSILFDIDYSNKELLVNYIEEELGFRKKNRTEIGFFKN